MELPELPAWETATSRGLLPISLALAEDGLRRPPRYNASFRRISALKVAGLSVDGLIAMPRRGSLRRGHYLKILFVTNGQSRIWLDGQQLILSAGTWVMYDPTRPYRIDSTGLFECVAVAVPAGQLPPFDLLSFDCAYPIVGNMRLALDAITFCLNGHVNDEDELAATGQAILTLIASSVVRHMGATSAPDVPRREAFLLARIDQHIRACFTDPDFTIDSLAETLHVSRRSVYNALKTQDRTPYKVIQQYRLEASCRTLRDETQRHKSVTEIALESGFADPTHFSRLFRQRFGMTPTEYRSTDSSTMLVD
ncbi:TPA: helix-turn-helix domain-containing protein [Pseudomonas aeruginosa]|nr:helix-turn-helix domain-containing protein [Pseudomonas aeruginosa]